MLGEARQLVARQTVTLSLICGGTSDGEGREGWNQGPPLMRWSVRLTGIPGAANCCRNNHLERAAHDRAQTTLSDGR